MAFSTRSAPSVDAKDLFRTSPCNKVSNAITTYYAVRMNFWFWLLIILVPVIVFSVKPQANPWLRIGRLALAAGLTYIFINLGLHLSIDHAWEAYDSCRFELGGRDPYERSLAEKLDKICPGAPNSGLPEVFYLVLGWIPAAAYVGFFELIWRIWRRDTIQVMGNTFKGKWASNALIIFSIPVWLYILVILALYIFLATCHWFIPSDKCLFGG